MSKTKIEKISNQQYNLIGRLDADSIPLVLTQLFSLNQNESIEVNLDGVTHSSSAGIAFLLEWLRQANSKQQGLTFINMPDKMKAIAEICGLSDILPVK